MMTPALTARPHLADEEPSPISDSISRSVKTFDDTINNATGKEAYVFYALETENTLATPSYQFLTLGTNPQRAALIAAGRGEILPPEDMDFEPSFRWIDGPVFTTSDLIKITTYHLGDPYQLFYRRAYCDGLIHEVRYPNLVAGPFVLHYECEQLSSVTAEDRQNLFGLDTNLAGCSVISP